MTGVEEKVLIKTAIRSKEKPDSVRRRTCLELSAKTPELAIFFSKCTLLGNLDALR